MKPLLLRGNSLIPLKEDYLTLQICSEGKIFDKIVQNIMVFPGRFQSVHS